MRRPRLPESWPFTLVVFMLLAITAFVIIQFWP